MSEINGAQIHISGVVQGVGFRPFVFGLAARLALKGWVRNTSAGVDIRVDGAPETLDAFVRALRDDAPPLARIDEITVAACAPDGFTGFQIEHSQPVAGAFQPISPDIAICPDCLRELFDPADRRYRYPFINCTNCGPRLTIIDDLPYDRPNTTMAPFEMCSECAAEYTDPLNRRFHAQPVACPRCGPQVWFETGGTLAARREEAMEAARTSLARGEIVAIKGLGGFHLACDAANAASVAELRRRKLRVDKPFALMMPDLTTVEAHCYVNEAERDLLTSRERPIVLLRRRASSPIAAEVAPGQDTLGVMLPYTPLHYLLVARNPKLATLVMTSGNVSEEPIATDNDEARTRLRGLADAFLMHDRGIRTRCDDSVMRVLAVRDAPLAVNHSSLTTLPLRRSRGYAPFPVRIPWESPPALAAGAELKNTFCVTRDRYAFLSHHIGDLENFETLQSYEEGVTHFERLFRIRPEVIAYDLHPNYLATRYALARAERDGMRAVGVQHHHAHIAACMAEHGLVGDRPVLGVAFDGTGYGPDGAIWGGEFLIADYCGYRRPYHLAYVPMPGGDRAVREPWRLALAWLARAGIEWSDDLPPVRAGKGLEIVRALCAGDAKDPAAQNPFAPLTSSMGRLFDAFAALIGVRATVNYEAQAAMELETRVDASEPGAYEFEIGEGVIDPRPVICAAVDDLRAGVEVGRMAARFHNGAAEMVHRACVRLRAETGLDEIALSGGVWQNVTLAARTLERLQADGFTVYWHREVPANDGGLALGQAAIAIQTTQENSND